MRLLTVGDSFTYGDELADNTKAWPHLLAAKMGAELQNLGRGASGNTRMVRTAVEQINTYDAIIVAWSHYARMEFADRQGIFDVWPGMNSYHCNANLRGDVLRYINRAHDPAYLYKQHLLMVILLQRFLSAAGKQYVMLDTFENHTTFTRSLCTDERILQQIDTSYYLGWPDTSMACWTQHVPRGIGGHFLEEGHAIVAQRIYDYIRHLQWVP
jgi:lysophospholipase L1-like esterase